jgi:AcrR family transcriptional regulator
MATRSPLARLTATKEQILLAAEKLYGAYGIDAVSLREIGVEAKQANSAAVHYHFKNKHNLLDAIFAYRRAQLEGRRIQMLEQAERQGQLDDPGVLLRILCLPHLDIVTEDGQYPYASFIVQFASRYWHEARAAEWTEASEVAPTLERLVELLARTSGEPSLELAKSRVMLCNLMVLTALLRWANVGRKFGATPLSAVMRDALLMAEQALRAPHTKSSSLAVAFEEQFFK